jgi:hypothetical protein
VGGAEGLSGEFKACALHSSLLICLVLSSLNLVLEPCTIYNKLVQSWGQVTTIHSFDFGGIAVRTKRKRDGPPNQWPLERQWGASPIPCYVKILGCGFPDGKIGGQNQDY